MNSMFLRIIGFVRDVSFVAAISMAPYAMASAIIITILYFTLIWHACTTETKRIINNLHGLDFEISETDCDTFGSSGSSISVFVAQAGRNERTEIFQFNPTYYVPLPAIEVVASGKRIVISVKKIGSIYFQKHRWEDKTVDFNIGEIAYPHSPRAPQEPVVKPH
jgi:hypothetical protein